MTLSSPDCNWKPQSFKMEKMMKCGVCIVRIVSHNSSLVAGFLGVVLGLFLKFYLKRSDWIEFQIDLPGEMLLRMLEMITIPLIVSTVVIGFSPLRGEVTATFALRAKAVFLSTTILSMTLGLPRDEYDDHALSFDTALMNALWNLAPENSILACYRQHRTDMIEVEKDFDEQRLSPETNETQVRLVLHNVEGPNILGLVFWSFIFGQVINRITQCTHVSLDAISSINKVTKHAVNMILWYEPFALVFMVTSLILEAEDWEILFQLGIFIGVVVLGLVIFATVVLPLIYFLCTKRNPYAVIKGVFPALKNAFISSSSSATLPITFQCCEERLQINRRISRFMLPIETKISMNGSVLYEVVAAIFIAQLNNTPSDLNQWMTIAMTSAVLCTGPAGVPARGAVTTFFILRAVDLPAKEACILVFVESLLDRCCTFVNVLGGCIGVALLHHMSLRDLRDTEGQREETCSVMEDEREEVDRKEKQLADMLNDCDV
ncbi:excitatory amino acid transporter 3-like isoform X2 [Clinocottus analis]|uniref:excitatory amino acid transporter 3-like isoform X2 n=1 Tax=Clinocottus analis TaxID=304258 RepID=UPI0035BF9799